MIPMMTLVIFNHDQTNTLETVKFQNTYGTFLDGLSLNGVVGKYWNIMVLVRWSLVSVILVSLRNDSTAQILMNIGLSWLF